jgi:hypothetical protein
VIFSGKTRFEDTFLRFKTWMVSIASSNPFLNS